MSKWALLVFSAILTSATAQPLNISKTVELELMKNAEKYVHTTLVTDFLDFSKVNKSLETVEGKNRTVVWIRELRKIIFQVKFLLKPYVKNLNAMMEYFKELQFQVLDPFAKKYYDKRRSPLPWAKINFDYQTLNVTLDVNAQQENQIADRNITDPFVTDVQVDKYMNRTILTCIKENNRNDTRKKLMGKRSSEIDYLEAMENIFNLFNILI